MSSRRLHEGLGRGTGRGEGYFRVLKLVLFAGVYFLPNSPVTVSQHGFSTIFVGIYALASRVSVTSPACQMEVRWALLCN